MSITELTHTGLIATSEFAASVIGFIGIAIMIYGAMRSGIRFAIHTIQGKNHLPHIRLDFGKHLSLGLEFLIGKDIIESIIRPDWQDVGMLAAIVAIRTVVTLFLSWEMGRLKDEVRQEQEVEQILEKKKGENKH